MNTLITITPALGATSPTSSLSNRSLGSSAMKRWRSIRPEKARNVHESSEDIARCFLNEARLDAEGNPTAALDLATDAAGAEEVEMTPVDVECFVRGQHRSISGFDATVYLDGLQARDGAVSWSLFVRVEDRQPMTADEVRELAAKLIEAADELERTSQR